MSYFLFFDFILPSKLIQKISFITVFFMITILCIAHILFIFFIFIFNIFFILNIKIQRFLEYFWLLLFLFIFIFIKYFFKKLRIFRCKIIRLIFLQIIYRRNISNFLFQTFDFIRSVNLRLLTEI